MEFFDWMQVPWLVAEYLELSVDSPESAANLILRVMQISLGVAAGLYLLGLVFGGIGLMKLAKRQNIAYWWIGFLPFGNTYLIGKLAGETTIFGKKCKRVGLYAVLMEIAYVVLEILLLVFMFMLTRAEFYDVFTRGENVYYDFSAALFKELYPNMGWVLSLQTAVEIIGYVWWFITFFFMCTLYNAFFRKYYAKSPFLMTFLCAFLPLKGYVLFAVRDNNPVDYNAYQQRRYQETYGGYNGGQGGYGGNYGEYNDGNRPFSDFGSNGNGGSGSDDPFSDFNGNSPNGGSNGSSNGSGGYGGGSSNGDSPFNDF